MASGNKIVIAFLSVSTESSTDKLIEQIKRENYDFRCVFVKLTQQDLQSFQPGETYDAVVLLHSISQGRNSITDVAVAKYSKFLPTLKKIYGPDRVAVVVHSMTSFNSNTKKALMMIFKKSQPTTFQCSKCVIQCNNLAEMLAGDLSRLAEFLGKVRDHPLPIPEDEAHSTLTTTPSADKIERIVDPSQPTNNHTLMTSTPSAGMEDPVTSQRGACSSDTTSMSQASSKVDTSPDKYAIQDKVIDTTYPIALFSLSTSNQLMDDLQQQLPGKTIMSIKDMKELARNWHLFEVILVDLGSLPEAASYSSDEDKGALDIYQKCVKEMLVPQNLAMLKPAPTNTPSDHKHADTICMISEIDKATEVSVFQYSSESCRPSLFDVDTKIDWFPGFWIATKDTTQLAFIRNPASTRTCRLN